MQWKTQRAVCFSVLASSLLLASLVACHDAAGPGDSVTGVTITPPSLVMNVGDRVRLVATVTAGMAQMNRSVRWTTENAAVATVDSSGVLESIRVGATKIIATSVADPNISAAATVTVGSGGPSVVISAINQDGKAADLSSLTGQIDVIVAVPAEPQVWSIVGLSLNCTGADTVVATQSMVTSALITLSFTTAGLKNGECVLRVQATAPNGTIDRSTSLLIKINNPGAASAGANILPGEVSGVVSVDPIPGVQGCGDLRHPCNHWTAAAVS